MSYQFENNGRLREPTAEELVAADPHSAMIVLNDGTLADGTPYWAYIALKPSKYKAFMAASRNHERIVLNDYGVILKYGFGKEVPIGEKEAMKQQYGFDENCMSAIANDVLKDQGMFLKQKEAKRIDDIVAMMKKHQAS